jgi:rhodanese-related sulfurtransferase
MRQLTPRELADWLADPARDKPRLLDVREPWEFQHCRIEGSVLVPLHRVADSLDELDGDAPTVVICHHGARSFQAAYFLEQNGFGQLYNLAGGVDAWARTVDPSMPTY